MDVSAESNNPLEIELIAGATPVRRKIDNNEGRNGSGFHRQDGFLLRLVEGLEKLLAQGGHHRLDLAVGEELRWLRLLLLSLFAWIHSEPIVGNKEQCWTRQ